MKTFPCAKINLGLYVTERRPDGYHNLQTVFYPIPLADELDIDTTSADNDSLSIEGIQVEGRVEDNLVMRALHLLRNEGHRIPPLRIRLKKNIPSGAGLGGGSSDAAFTMKMLNEMFGLGLSDDDMEHRVARLGADCPFFVRRRPVYATGIGDLFTPLPLDLTGIHLLLVKPDDFISTREAYQGVCPQQPEHDLRETILRPVEDWPQFIENDFERSVFPQHPTVAAIKERLYSQGALYAAMSGSGSSVFGLFRGAPASSMLETYRPHFVFSAPL